jgi:hypothetical protein
LLAGLDATLASTGRLYFFYFHLAFAPFVFLHHLARANRPVDKRSLCGSGAAGKSDRMVNFAHKNSGSVL